MQPKLQENLITTIAATEDTEYPKPTKARSPVHGIALIEYSLKDSSLSHHKIYMIASSKLFSAFRILGQKIPSDICVLENEMG
jgi:hypothetical protein